MHPAFSIVFFTTASGAGYALLLLLGIGVPLGLLPDDRWFGLAALATAGAFAAGGLSSSVLHLGRPERAWRAFSQWRSSWLSREGVFAVLTFAPTLAFAIGWLVFGATSGGFGFCGFLAAILAAVTIRCTGMIYASLKPIRQWHNRLTVPNYVSLALMSGLLLLDLLIRFWVARPLGAAILTLVATAAAWWLKEAYWRLIDGTLAGSTAASATALGRFGRVRLLEPPHTQDNYLLREMGYRVARKHRRRLRALARLAAFVVPGALTLAALIVAGGPGIVLAAVAAATAAFGLVIERWLFFAEATHTVMLYYGAEAA